MVKFAKMTAGGNDFVVIDNRGGHVRSRKNLARQLCERRISIGADGLLLIEKSSKNAFKMRIFNPDGSEAEMCGNGARCIARFALEKKIARDEMVFETSSGEVEALVGKKMVRLKMSEPTDIRLSIKLKIGGKEYTVHYVITGVPHTVLFVMDLDKADVHRLGRKIRRHRQFQPEGTNVDFVKVHNKNSISIRTYERGVEDETLSCGTGAAASAIVSALLEKTKSPVMVRTRGGSTLKIRSAGKNIYLEGEAKPVYEGKVRLINEATTNRARHTS